jgi:transcriptional regulator with XRE-family HTH domain
MSAIIRSLRMERGWTQEELGERVGVSAQAVSKWETGQSLPDISQVPLLAKAFGVTTDLLFGLAEEPEPDFSQFDSRCTDPEEAWQQWREMGRKLEEGPENDTLASLYLYQGYLLCYPDSLVYHPEHAKEARDELLAFADKSAKRTKQRTHTGDYSLASHLTNLNALAGNEEKALGQIKDAPEWPQELSWIRRGEVFRLLGKRKEEREQLLSVTELLIPCLLMVLYRRGDSALALGQRDEALYCVRYGQDILRLMSGAEKVDPLFAQDGNGFLQLGARVLLAQGKREEALDWLKEMVDEKLESLLPGYAVAVNTPLYRGVQIAPARWDEKTLRYIRALLLHSLDHPDFAPLRDDPEFQAIRARAEAILGEG